MRISDWSSDVCSSDLGTCPRNVFGDHAAVRAVQAADLIDQPQLGAGQIEVAPPPWAPVIDGPHAFATRACQQPSLGPHGDLDIEEIGRASCRERVCQYV